MFTKAKVDTTFALAKVADLVMTRGQRNAEDDEVGVELELEGGNLEEAFNHLRSTGCDFFLMKGDGSLRNGMEFVFTKALNRVQAKKGIQDFFKVFHEKATINNSERCSTHMHFNFQHRTVMQVYSFLTLFYMLELPFFQKFAPERVGNNYCLPLFECPTIGVNYAKNLKEGVFRHGVQHRYTAMNVASLPQYGSLECRMLGGSDSADKPIQWMEVVLELYDYVKNNPRMTPADIMAQKDFTEFVKNTFPTVWTAIKDIKDVERLIEFGTYSVQDFVYAVDWTEAKTAKDPGKVRKVDPVLVPAREVPSYNLDEYSDYVSDNW